MSPVDLADRPAPARLDLGRPSLLSPLLVTVALAALVALVWALVWTAVL